MTTYITITDAETDPEAPLTSELAKKWRDNPIAIAEGDVNAPKIVGSAMYSPAAGSVLQRNCLAGGSQAVVAGSTSTTGFTEKEFVRNSNFTAIVPCTVRLTVTFTTSGSVLGRNLRVFKNGTLLQNWTTNQTNATLNISLDAGDSTESELSVTSQEGATATVTLSKFQYSFDVRSAVMT